MGGWFGGGAGGSGLVVGGTKADGRVPTVQADNTTVEWEAQTGGSGLSITGTPADGDYLAYSSALTSWVPQKEFFNIIAYGAGRDYRQCESTGTNAPGTTFNLASGHGQFLKPGNSVVIHGAGAAHSWAAVTPDTPVVTSGGGTTFTRSSGDIIQLASFLGVTSGETFTRSSNTIVTQHLGVADGHSCYLATTTTLPGGLSPGTEYFLRQVAGTTTSYTLHTSRAGAIANTGQVTLSSAGTGIHTIHVTMPVRVWSSGTLPAGGMAIDTTYYLRQSTTLYTYTLHDTAANAAANSGTVTLSDAGTGTHSIMPWGAETCTYSNIGFSGKGGHTVKSSAGTTTGAWQTLTKTVYNVITFGEIVDGSSNPCHGGVIYADRTGGTRHAKFRWNLCKNAHKVTLLSSGFTSFVPTDIGKACGGGTLVQYDNTARTAIIKDAGNPTVLPDATAITVTNGAGAGTTTGASIEWYAIEDHGDFEFDVDHPPMVWGTGHEEQVVQISGTPTSGTYSLFHVHEEANVAYNASSATLQSGLQGIPGISDVQVTSRSGSGANLAHTIRFQHATDGDYGLGDVAQLTSRSAMSGGTPVISIATTRPGKTNRVGDIILHPASASGSFYECIDDTPGWGGDCRFSPSLSTTLNAQKWTSRGVRWQRVNCSFPVTEPAAAVADAHFTKGTAISTDALTLQDATVTSVASGTPVWRNDLPAAQAALTAARSAGYGEVLFPGQHSFFSRTVDASEWTNAGGTIYGLLPFSNTDSTQSITFRGIGNARITWRAMQVECFRNDEAYQDSFHCLIALNGAQRFGWFGGEVVYAPQCEPRAGFSNGQHSVALFRKRDEITPKINAGELRIDDLKVLGLPNGMGTPFSDGEVPLCQPLYTRVHLRYGGCNHDAGMGPCGRWERCFIEGTNTNRRSTAFYTNFGDIPCELIDCNFWQLGKDGIRMRNQNFLMRGGSIICDNRCTNLDQIIQFESTASGGRLEGVTIKTQWEQIEIECNDISIDDCKFRNSYITASNSDQLRITRNKFFVNAAIQSTTLEKFIQIDSGNDDVLVEGNIIQVSSNVPSVVTSGLSLAASTNVVIRGNILRGTGATGRGILVNTTFAGNAIIENNFFIGSASSSNASNTLQAANGAVVKCSNNFWDGSNKTNPTLITGATTARYEFDGDTFLNEFEVASTPTGQIWLRNCNMADGTNAADLANANIRAISCDFAIAPTVTAAIFTQGCTVAGLQYTSVTLSANTDNLAFPVTDFIQIQTSGTNNYNLTSMVAGAEGVKKWFTNVDLTDDITFTHLSGGSSQNQWNHTSGASVVVSSGDSIEAAYLGGVWRTQR